MVTNVLEEMGAPIKVQGMIYKALFQVFILHESKSWVVTDTMMMVIEVFCLRTDIRILGITERKDYGR